MSLALIAALLKGPKESGRLPQPGSSRPLPRRRLLMTLLVTLLWATGSFTFFTYLAVVLHKTAGVSGLGVALYLLLFGIAGTIGVTVAGRAVDARGGAAILTLALLFVAASLSGLALTAALTPPHRVAVVVTAAMVILYGLGTWAVTPPQQDRLLRNGNSGRVVLSLNASALYGGVVSAARSAASFSPPRTASLLSASLRRQSRSGRYSLHGHPTTELSHRNAEVDRIPRTAVKRPHQPQRLNVCG
jgi:predicted MFS family arabinose efflux permease